MYGIFLFGGGLNAFWYAGFKYGGHVGSIYSEDALRFEPWDAVDRARLMNFQRTTPFGLHAMARELPE